MIREESVLPDGAILVKPLLPPEAARARSEKWEPVFGKNARQNKRLERRSDSVRSQPALTSDPIAQAAAPNNRRPRMPATIRPRHTSRGAVTGSLNSTMPRVTAPTAPMPVQTA